MAYNLTSIVENSTGIATLAQGVNNELMHHTMGILFLIGIVSVMFIGFIFSTNEVKKSMSAAAFVAFGLSLFLRALDLIPNLAIFITLIGAAAAVAANWRN